MTVVRRLKSAFARYTSVHKKKTNKRKTFGYSRSSYGNSEQARMNCQFDEKNFLPTDELIFSFWLNAKHVSLIQHPSAHSSKAKRLGGNVCVRLSSDAAKEQFVR
jgi:hypothetical protein